MPEKNLEIYSALTYVWLFGIAVIGGVVSFMKKVKDGKPWRISEFIAEIATSAFAGIITMHLCQWADISLPGTAALVGIAGHMGTRLVTLLEKLFEDKLEQAANRLLGEDKKEEKSDNT